MALPDHFSAAYLLQRLPKHVLLRPTCPPIKNIQICPALADKLQAWRLVAGSFARSGCLVHGVLDRKWIIARNALYMHKKALQLACSWVSVLLSQTAPSCIFW